MTDKTIIRARFMAALSAGCSTTLATQIANGQAPMPGDPEPPPPGPEVPAPPAKIIALASQEHAQLRAAYLALVGRKPYGGWDVETLRAKLEEKRAELA